MPVEDCLNNLLAQFDKPCPHEPLAEKFDF